MKLKKSSISIFAMLYWSPLVVCIMHVCMYSFVVVVH